MKKKTIYLLLPISLMIVLVCCDKPSVVMPTTAGATNGGFGSQILWGEHIVTTSGCHDCHSPKKFGAMGFETDSTRMLSGHPADAPPIDAATATLQAKGIIMTNDLTTWVGPWGTSYTANLTSDETGIGNWSEAQFITAIRKGKFKGLEGGRDLLPPMPWPFFAHFTDDELKAIFAYLKSTLPVKNVVPAPLPPAMP